MTLTEYLASSPTECAICKSIVPFDKTRIHEMPVLRCNEDGTPKPVFYGMATVAEVRICANH